MEDRVDLLLQLPGYDRLRDPVGHGRHPEHPGATTVRLLDLHRAHRRWEARPDDIRFQILNRLPCRSFSNSVIVCPSTPAAPPFALTFSHASQTARFETSNGLSGAFSSSTRLLPEHSG